MWLHCTVKFNQIFKEELTLILPQLFQKMEEGGTPLKSFYNACITLIHQKKSQGKEITEQYPL